jgi:hypothetical protein
VLELVATELESVEVDVDMELELESVEDDVLIQSIMLEARELPGTAEPAP